ncbi:nudix hydrolase 7-like isoform X3 [Fagus crenata]
MIAFVFGSGDRFSFVIRNISFSTSSISVGKEDMADYIVQQAEQLNPVNDIYGGVIVNVEQPMDSKVYSTLLRASMSQWRQQEKRGIWIKLPIQHVNLVEATVKEGFRYHHAEKDYLLLVCWLPETTDTIPEDASHRVGTGAFVMNSHREVLVDELACCMLRYQDVVQVIPLSKKDVWNNQELFSSVEDYFDNCVKTLDSCTSLENCLKRTCDNQLMIIQLAVSHFEEEVSHFEEEVGGGVDAVKYVKTLQELRRFMATEDPFMEEFFLPFESVCKQHELFYKKLLLKKGKLDKKLKFWKAWGRVSSVISVTFFLSVLIFSVVAPPAMTAVAAVLAVQWAKWKNVVTHFGGALRMQ